MEKREGFTLMELMVVIVIMGILAGVAAPKLMGFIERTKRSVDATSALEISHILRRAYFAEEIPFGNGGDGAILQESKFFSVIVSSSGVNYYNGSAFGTIDKVFSDINFSGITVKAQNTDGGWACYGVVLKSDGHTTIFSSTNESECTSNSPQNLIANALNGQTSIGNYLAGAVNN